MVLASSERCESSPAPNAMWMRCSTCGSGAKTPSMAMTSTAKPSVVVCAVTPTMLPPALESMLEREPREPGLRHMGEHGRVNRRLAGRGMGLARAWVSHRHGCRTGVRAAQPGRETKATRGLGVKCWCIWGGGAQGDGRGMRDRHAPGARPATAPPTRWSESTRARPARGRWGGQPSIWG